MAGILDKIELCVWRSGGGHQGFAVVADPRAHPSTAPPTPPPPARPCVQSKFRVNQHCKVLCRIGSLNKAQANAFKSRISDEYRVNM